MSFDIIVPQAGESVTEADIASWMKESGEYVALDEGILELETEKATLVVTAGIAGTLEVLVEEGETVNVGDIIGRINAAEAPAGTKEASAPVVSDAVSEEVPKANTPTGGTPSPAARQLLSENAVSAGDIQGSGKDNRITKQDVLQHLETRQANEVASAKPATSTSSSPNVKPTQVEAPDSTAPAPVAATGDRVIRAERMTRMRRTIAQHLVKAKQNSAMLTTFNEVDMSAIMDIRKKYKEQFKDKHNANLGFMSFFAKATAMALREFPIMNAQIDGQNIVYHDFVDMGVAVSTPKGLVVPIIRDTTKMSFHEIESKIVELAIKGRENNLKPDEMTGGTFTITNGGTFGSMLSTPIINQPQSAILGMHNIVKRPVVVDDQIVIRPIMYLAVSYDHRIIDGSDAVRFLVKIKTLLEDPTRILLDL